MALYLQDVELRIEDTPVNERLGLVRDSGGLIRATSAEYTELFEPDKTQSLCI